MPATRKKGTQRGWYTLGIAVPRSFIRAIDKAAVVEAAKLQEGPISRAKFCRMVLEQDPRVNAQLKRKEEGLMTQQELLDLREST